MSSSTSFYQGHHQERNDRISPLSGFQALPSFTLPPKNETTSLSGEFIGFYPVSNWPTSTERVDHLSSDAALHPTCPPPSPGTQASFSMPACYTLVWGSQGLRKTQFTIFPQWWSPNGSPAPQLLVKLRLPFAHDVVSRWFQGEGRREAQTPTPKPYRPEELCRFVPYPRYPPTPLTTGSSQRRKILPMSGIYGSN